MQPTKKTKVFLRIFSHQSSTNGYETVNDARTREVDAKPTTSYEYFRQNGKYCEPDDPKLRENGIHDESILRQYDQNDREPEDGIGNDRPTKFIYRPDDRQNVKRLKTRNSDVG